MVARVMISGVWRPIADVLELLNHPGHADQKSHGRGGAGEGTRVTRDDFAKDAGGADPLQIGEGGRDAFMRHSAEQTAKRWDVSREDFDELARETGGSADAFKDMSLKDAKAAFLESAQGEWMSHPSTVGMLAAHAVASRLGADFKLQGDQGDTVAYAAGRPGLQRATSSMGEAIYSSTQDWFADRGITSVAAHRVTSNPGIESHNLTTSWSTMDSGHLQGARGGTDIEATIPVSRIFAIPPAGLASIDEGELIVMPPAGG